MKGRGAGTVIIAVREWGSGAVGTQLHNCAPILHNYMQFGREAARRELRGLTAGAQR